MEPERKKKLSIIKDVKKVSYLQIFCVYVIVFLALLSVALVPWHYELRKTSTLFGDDTNKLIHDYTKWDKRHIPVSAWMDRNYFMNGSFYRKSLFDDQLTMDIVYFNCNLYPFLPLAFMVLVKKFRLLQYIFSMAIRKLGKKKMLYSLATNIIVSCTLVIGVICNVELIIQLVKNIFQWIETRVIDATPLLNVNAPLQFPHPTTMGKLAPYFLYTYHRYPMEDAVFKCEYQTREPFPIFKSAKWRKNGLPLQIKDDRIHVNISIRKVNASSELYNVLSILTIKFLEDSDFGSYTCGYHNPFRFTVKPGPAMSEDFGQRSFAKHMPKREPKCNCKPRELDNDKSKNAELVEFYECFSEFLLIKINETVINRLISPGSIFIEGALYSTVAEIDEIEMEVTDRGNDGPVDNCCSLLVLFYWNLFREGNYMSAKLPFTRIIIADHGVYFVRYNCLCKNSYGVREFRLSRNFYNTTTRKQYRAEIIYPIKQRLLPIYTHPWSNITNTTDSNSYSDDNSCLDLGFSSPQCWAHGKLFESSIHTMYWYETCITCLFILAAAIVSQVIYHIVLRQCIRPIYRAVIYGNKKKIPFQCVNGKPLNNLRPFNDQEANGPENHMTLFRQNKKRLYYQIYLSYDIENEFDSMLAELIKDNLLSIDVSVFDSQKDVPCGRLEIEELQNATSRSSRFVVIASEDYAQNKDFEFNLIQAVIFGQNSRPKDRLLIIMSEEFEMKRLYQVPCILVSEDSKARHVVEETTIEKFRTWEKSTRPNGEICLIDNTNDTAVDQNRELNQAIRILIYFILVILKRYLYCDF